MYSRLRRSFHPSSVIRTETVLETGIHQLDGLWLIRFVLATPHPDVHEITKFTPLTLQLIETDHPNVNTFDFRFEPFENGAVRNHCLQNRAVNFFLKFEKKLSRLNLVISVNLWIYFYRFVKILFSSDS
jgi:hypothetical protein